MSNGTLYIVGTPIGNLEDISQRALKVLQEVSYIAAEDTRMTSKLLKHYGIKNRLSSYHKFSEEKKKELIIRKLLSGNSVALVSDAGLPGISDPGEILIREVLEKRIRVEVIPGPTAFILGVILSGLNTVPFTFFGFLPKKEAGLRKFLMSVKNLPYTLVFYEAPTRIKKTIRIMIEVFGNRKGFVGKELTKLHETQLRGTLQEIYSQLGEIPIKGEFVIVVEGSGEEVEEPMEVDIKAKVTELQKFGLSKNEAIKFIASKYRIPKREVYKSAIRSS